MAVAVSAINNRALGKIGLWGAVIRLEPMFCDKEGKYHINRELVNRYASTEKGEQTKRLAYTHLLFLALEIQSQIRLQCISLSTATDLRISSKHESSCSND